MASILMIISAILIIIGYNINHQNCFLAVFYSTGMATIFSVSKKQVSQVEKQKVKKNNKVKKVK